MSIGLIISLIAVLLVLILGYNIMLQYKVKAESSKKQEATRYVTVIDAAEELLSYAHNLPYSKALLNCLNHRILDALENMQSLDPKNKHLSQRIDNVKQQIDQVNQIEETGDGTNFKLPTSDKQAIVLLKLVKRLRETIRNEHNKGRFDTQAYIAENNRLETIQIRINIENLIKRAHDAIARTQPGTALQLLRKGIDVLSSKNDPYSTQAKAKLENMLERLDQKRQDQQDEDMLNVAENERDNDMDALFGQKKKW